MTTLTSLTLSQKVNNLNTYLKLNAFYHSGIERRIETLFNTKIDQVRSNRYVSEYVIEDYYTYFLCNGLKIDISLCSTIHTIVLRTNHDYNRNGKYYNRKRYGTYNTKVLSYKHEYNKK